MISMSLRCWQLSNTCWKRVNCSASDHYQFAYLLYSPIWNNVELVRSKSNTKTC